MDSRRAARRAAAPERRVPAAFVAILCALGLAFMPLFALVTAAPAAATTLDYFYSGAPQSLVVPAGVSSLQVTAIAGGGSSYTGTAGGYGAGVSGTVAVDPGMTVWIYVGGRGSVSHTSSEGFNGGGAGWAGGGASDIRIGGQALSDRVIVAGGGGGGDLTPGGNGGAPDGTNGGNITGGATGGSGGTQSAGGAGGTGDYSGTSGTLGSGGAAASRGGGGGGGGYYGGGGGACSSSGGNCNGSAGGGGSSWLASSVTGGSYLGSSSAGNGSVSITYAPPPEPPLAPFPPTAVTAGAGELDVAWFSPGPGGSAIDYYEVSMATSAAGPFSVPASGSCSTDTSALHCKATGLDHSQSYYFKVRAHNADGFGPKSAAGGPFVPLDVPGPPTGVAGAAGVLTADVTWSAPLDDGGSALTGFALQQSDDGGQSWTASSPQPSGTTAAASVTGLTGSIPYLFRVRALNALGHSTWAVTATAVTPLPVPVPGTPGTPTASPGEAAGQLAVSWTAPADAGGSPIDYYEAAMGTSPDGPFAAPDSGTCSAQVAGVSCSASDLDRSTLYYFTVRAHNADGMGPWSPAGGPFVPLGLPDPPTAVQGAAAVLGAEVSWTAPADDGGSSVTGYVLEQSADAGQSWEVSSPQPAGASVSASVTGLTPSASYLFRVQAVTALGSSSWASASAAVVPLPEPTPTPTPTPSPAAPTPEPTRTPKPGPVPEPTRSPVPDPTTAAPTPTTPPSPTAGRQQELTLRLDAGVGDPVAGAPVTLSGEGLQAGSVVSTTAHSDPIALEDLPVAADGTFAGVVYVPELPAGMHHLIAEGTGQDGQHLTQSVAFAVTAAGTIGAIGEDSSVAFVAAADVAANSQSNSQAATSDQSAIDAVDEQAAKQSSADPDSQFLPYSPLSEPKAVLAVGVGAFAVLALAGGGALASSGSASGSPAGSRRSAKVAGAETKRVVEDDEVLDWGDRSRTWRWPGTSTLDRMSQTRPPAAAPVSPLLARILVDGTYLRAMLGTLWWLLPLVAGVLAAFAVNVNNGSPLPPPMALLVIILVIGVLDAFAGAVAVAVYAIGVTVSGGLATADSVRILMGVAVIWYAVPLIAAASRPLRRLTPGNAAEWFDRCGDVVIAALIGGFAAQKMVGAWPGLSGLQLPIVGEAGAIALIALAAIALRIILESAATALYPKRLDAVEAGKLPSSSAPQQLVSLVVRAAVFVFVAVVFIGNSWQLWAGLALFCIPPAMGVFKARLPKSMTVFRLIPTGIVRVVLMILVGTAAAAAAAHYFPDPADMLQNGFFYLSIPGAILLSAAVFAADGKKRELTWAWRAAGTAVLLAGIWLSV